MRYITTLVLILSSCIFAQDVAVSEYYNLSGTPTNEWIELIVLDDDVDLDGYILRDNGGPGGALSDWSGGIEFKDVDLWKNLRQGTIIVVNNRGTNAVDDNKSDGYIEISAQNTTYFDQIVYIGNDWAGASLNFGQDSEIVELYTGSRTEHALAHVPNQPNGDLLTIPDNRHLAANSTLSARWSVRVLGDSKADYVGGFRNNGDKVIAELVGNVVNSKGVPNSDQNSNYWRELREPDWNNPNLNINANGTDLVFSWSDMEIDHDNSQGYLIVAYPKTNGFGDDDLPEDGESYDPGDEISNGSLVLANVDSDEDQFVVSTENLDCDENYTFRVYAFRYDDDDQNRDSDPENARGRSYNQDDFAELEFQFDNPDEPTVTTEQNAEVICEGGTLLLSTEDNGFSYQWFFNGNEISGATNNEYLADTPGKYSVSAIGSNGCAVESEEITLTLERNPFARIRFEDRIMEDTTFVICPDESIALNGVGGEEVFWYKDGVRNGITENDVMISEAGTYYVEAINKGICTDFSNTITVQVININLTFDNTTIDFGPTNFINTRTLEISNNGNSELTLNEEDITLSEFFDLQNVEFPITIPAGESIIIEIVFAPTNSGDYSGTVEISGPCSYTETIELLGNKPTSDINISRANLPFGTSVSCQNIENETFEVSRIDDQVKTILSAEFENTTSPFDLVDPTNFPITINSDDPVDFEVEFAPIADGAYSNTLTLVISDDGVNPSFEEQILVSGIYREPSFEVVNELGNSLNNFTFQTVSGCGDGSIDSSYTVRNTGSVPINVVYPNDPRFVINNNPAQSIAPGEEEIVEFSFTPQAQIENGNLTISAEPCALQQSISFEGGREGFFVSTDDDTYQISGIYSCDLGGDRSRISVLVDITGESSDVISVDNISNLINYSISGNGLTDNFSVGDQAEFIFEMTQDPDGQTETVTIEFSPCGQVTFDLIGDVEEFSVISAPNSGGDIDFGLMDVGDSEVRTISILNPLDDDIVIQEPQGIIAPFRLTANNPAFPQTISAGQVLEIEVEYDPTIYDAEDEITFTLDVTSPCEDQLTYNLIGSTNPNDFIATVFLDVPNNLTADIKNYEVFNLPVELSSDEITAEEFNLTSLDFKITFNGSVFYVIEAFTPEFINQDIELSNPRYRYGDVATQLDVPTDHFEFGNIIQYICGPTIGNNYQTEIQIEVINAEFTGQAQIVTNSGFYITEEYCDRPYHLIQADQGINLEDGSIITSNTNIEFGGGDGFRTQIRLYDQVGNEISLFDAKTIDKIYRANIDVPPGTYILSYSIGSYIKNYRILVMD